MEGGGFILFIVFLFQLGPAKLGMGYDNYVTDSVANLKVRVGKIGRRTGRQAGRQAGR